jgi:hypothetical protein
MEVVAPKEEEEEEEEEEEVEVEEGGGGEEEEEEEAFFHKDGLTMALSSAGTLPFIAKPNKFVLQITELC